MHKKNSLAQDFKYFSAIILLVMLFTCVFVGWSTYISFTQKRNNTILHSADTLNNSLDDLFSYIDHYVKFIAEKITSNKNLNRDYITDLLTINLYKNQTNSPEWLAISWVDANHKILTNSLDGKTYHNILNRKYLQETIKHPNRLIFSPPGFGEISKQLILPAGFGVKDSHNNFLGTIGLGIGINRLAHELEKAILNNEVVFIMFDQDLNYILSSDTINHEDILDSIIPNIKEQLKKGTEISPIIINKYNFSFILHSEKYPFYFLIGENIKLAHDKYWQAILPRIAELILISIFFIITLYFFRKQIVKPIITLAQSAHKIARGDNVVIQQDQYLEINLLANQLKGIQHAKDALAQAKKTAETLNINLEQKIKERTQDLEKALAIRTEFLNNMSHEVRTPVQGITTISKSLVENWKKHSEEKKYALASAVSANSQRLFSLVSNILDLSIFNTGKLYFNKALCNVITLIDDIIIECRTLYIHNKSITINFANHPKEIILFIDSEKISQILRNLITNSIKFMNKGIIEISIILEGEYYVISIRDQGINLPTEDLKKIFLPFTQSDATKGKASGAGLGLSICSKIVEGHHGKIWANNNKGKGISVFFSLPIKHIHEEPIINLPAKSETHDGENYILMIDDEATCQMSMDLLLSNTGYQLVSQYGGVSGLEYLKDNSDKISLIFLDLMMPDMYGLNVLKILKEDPKLKNIPVIVQSGTNDSNEIEKTITMGAAAFIRKPYQRQQILDILKQILG